MGLSFKIIEIDAVDLNAPSTADVVKRIMTVTIASGTPIVTEITDLAATELTDPSYVGNVGDVVNASLVDEDASGNRSEATTASATLVDDFAPPAPGEFGFKTTGQV